MTPLPCPFCGAEMKEGRDINPMRKPGFLHERRGCLLDDMYIPRDHMRVWQRRNKKQGWRLVPVEPTDEQLEAVRDWKTAPYVNAAMYTRMVLTAPKLTGDTK